MPSLTHSQKSASYSESSVCAANEWMITQAWTQARARVWSHSELICCCNPHSDWKQPFRQAIACSDLIRTWNTGCNNRRPGDKDLSSPVKGDHCIGDLIVQVTI